MVNDTVKISFGAWEAEISPSLGANVVSLRYDGGDVLQPFAERRSSYLIGAPILMPANRTYEGRFSFEGREYSLPINEPRNNCNLHGSVLYRSFDAVNSTNSSVILRTVDRGCESYPFPYAMIVTYSLSEAGFASEYVIENIGEGNMPLTFCLHTTFMEPKVFSVPIDLCQEKDEHHIPTGRYVELDEQQRRYVSGSASEGVFITGYFRSCGKSSRIGDYTYSVSDNFDHWILFNGGGTSGILCVEPQAGKVNGLNYPDGHTVLSAGEKKVFSTLISRR